MIISCGGIGTSPSKDGTPYTMKVVCTVWSGGKAGDSIKSLPITIILQEIFRLGGILSYRKRKRE